MNPSRPPSFWELGAIPFQELSRDVLREDSEVKECHIYGKNGQSQFGIDQEAALHAGGYWAGQSKAYETLTWTDLRDAADEFWKHRARWKERGVKRFIVLAGGGVDDTKTWEQVRLQREKFEGEEIRFDLWDSRELVSRLRPHRAIVERHCKVGWAEIICGTATAGLAVAATGITGGAITFSIPLVDEISGLRGHRLSEIRDLVRAGKEISAERELAEMCEAPSWEALEPKIRARALRQRIGLALGRRKDVAGARNLLAEAKAISPNAPLKVPEALIAHHEEGAEAALKILESPTDLDEWNLQLGLLLCLGRKAEALEELEAPRFQPDAETWRLRAIAMLSKRNIAGARLAITNALGMNPTWRKLQEAAAVIDYYSALSPAVDPWLNFEWPTPPEWQFIRRDDESIAALRRAAECFEALAAAPEITETERKGLQVWHLAALANDAARETESRGLAKVLLDCDPSHIRVAIWASHRGYEFDRGSVRAALERECDETPASIEPVQALFAMLVNENEVTAAGRLLDTHLDLYEQRGAASIWRFQRAQAWMATDEKEKARALLAEENDEGERRKLEAVLARVEASRGGSHADVASAFAKHFAATNADPDLFAACEAHLYGKLPAYVAGHARELVRRINTESALRLALDGCFAVGEYDLCLEMLDGHLDLFSGREAPPVVHRLRVDCLRRTGQLVEAQRAAEILAHEVGESRDLFAVFETQRAAGDMGAAAVTGRQLLLRPDVTPDGLLHLSMHLKIDAPEIAKEAFEKVLQGELETAQQAAVAMQIGFDLGFDDQLGPVITQTIAAVGQPGAPLVAFTIDGTLEMMSQRRGASEESAAAYDRGEIPIHLYVQTHQISLANLYRGAFQLNEEAELPSRSFATMIRHGSRDEPRSLAKDSGAGLFLDVTSYLLAGQLGLLDLLEAEFAPVQVSPHLPSSLQGQLVTLASEQVARQPPKTEVLDLVAEQRIALFEVGTTETQEELTLTAEMGTRWSALLAHAQTSSGYLIDFLPLSSNDAAMERVKVPPNVAARLRSTGDVANGLKQSGALTAEQYDLAMQRLGGEGAISGAHLPLEPGACVVLESRIAENLAHAGVLRALASRCRVTIGIDEHRRLLGETAARRVRMGLVAWLRQLRDRLQRGLHEGIYVSKGRGQVHEEEADFTNTPEGQCVLDLLDDTRSSEIWTCCDDRFIGRFENVGESRLIDVFDLLHELRRRDKISTEVFHSHLARLRAGNARYLPISHEEILHQLSRATHSAKGLVETPELASLRRYAAACVLDTERLQRPPPDHLKARELTELKCIMAFHSEGTEALLRLWRDESLPSERLLAMSDWLLQQFLFDLAGALEVWNHGNLPIGKEIAGLCDANLIFRAIALGDRKRTPKDQEAPRQKVFVRWLMSRLDPDADRLAQIGPHLRAALLEPVRRARSGKSRLVAALVCSELYAAFPHDLQLEIGLKKTELSALKLAQWQPMALGDVSFDLRDFWRAAELAHRRGQSELGARVPAGLKFQMRPERKGKHLAVILESAKPKKRLRVSDASLGLVQTDSGKREACISAERRWLDVSQADADVVFPRIARIKNLQERMRQYYDLRENSLALHFGSLAELISQGDDVCADALKPPKPEVILNHLRLPAILPAGGLGDSLELAAATLLADEGFEEAFVRIAALPVALPAAFAVAFAGLDSLRRDKWVRQALAEITTPIMRIHLAGLLLDGNDEEIRSAVDVICGFASDEGVERFDAFEAVFSWTYREIITSAQDDLSEAAVLTAVWCYAARLHHLLSVFSEQAEIVRSFEEGAKPRPRELLRPQHRFWSDVAGPQLVCHETLTVHGAAAILEGRTLPTDLNEKLESALRKLCFPFPDSPTVPALPLLRIRSAQLDALGSFLAVCRTETLGRHLGADEAQRFCDSELHREVERLIDLLTKQPHDKEAWVNLLPYLGMLPPSADLRERFRRCLLAADWTRFADASDSMRQVIVHFLTSQSANFPDDEVRGHFRAQLASLARHFAASLTDRIEIESAALLLMHGAHFLAISRGNEANAAETLVSSLGDICDAWPGAANHIWRLNAPLLHRQPASTYPKLWPLIFRLRATASRLEP